MTRCRVGIGYFSFFVDDFFAVVVFAADLVVAFFAAAFAGTFAAFFATGAGASSATGSSVAPMAPASTSTTSDQRMWYVELSVYGITCTFGRLRPLRKTFGFTPSVSTSTFFSATFSLPIRFRIADVLGASKLNASIT